MDTQGRRASKRARKPTFKLKESKLDLGLLPVVQSTDDKTDSHNKVISVDIDGNNKEINRHNHNHEGTSSPEDDEGGRKTNSEHTERKEFQGFKKQMHKIEKRQENAVRNVVTERKTDEKHDNVLKISDVAQLKAESKSMIGTFVNSSEKKDAVKAVRKCTVRVLLKDGAIVQKEDRVNDKTIEKVNTDKQEIVENSLKHFNVANIEERSTKLTRKSEDYNLMSNRELKKLEDILPTAPFENVIKHTNHTCKEDGSFIEGCESDSCMQLDESFKSITKVRESTRQGEDCRDIESYELDVESDSIDEICENTDDYEEMTYDVDAQIKIEFDEFAETAEMEEGDFEEMKEEKSQECPVCFKVISNKWNLNKHLALHRGEKPYQCEICGMSFTIQSYLTIHSLVHSGKRDHKCDICGKAFLRRSNLNTHRRTHTDVKAYSCHTCDKIFKTKVGRDGHMKEHVEGLRFPCDHCGKSFTQQNYLQRHISVHKGEKPFKCTVCGKAFPYNQSLQEHMRRHTGEKPEVCNKCGKGFNNKRQLKAHMKYHDTVSAFACEECHMFYDSQQSLNKHITKSHNRKHECGHCKRSFMNKKHLRTHMATDHKELLASSRRLPSVDLAKARKAICSLCNRVFYNRYVLSKHLMSKHEFSEKDMKEMLHIRKKALSKKQIENYRASDVRDISQLLENDKGFRVYYKDDEMAVYVKGVEALDSRVGGTNDGDIIDHIANAPDQNVRFILCEDGKDAVDDALVKHAHEAAAGDSNDAVQFTDDMIQAIVADSEKQVVLPSGTSSNVTAATLESIGSTDQNYYVVLTESNETTGNSAIDKKVLIASEMQTVRDDTTERVVLVLNDEDSERNIVLENGEQYEIVEGSTEIVEEGYQDVEYEVVATCPVMDADEKRFVYCLDSQSEDKIEAYTDGDTNTNGEQSGRNLPLLDLLHSQVTASQIASQTCEHEITGHGNIEHKVENENCNIQLLSEDTGVNEKSAELHCSTIELSENLNTADNTLIDDQSAPSADTDPNIPAFNNKVVSSPKNTSFEKQLCIASAEELVPKSNSTQDFANFETAIKLKSSDFQDQSEYNDFLDRMIQTLQKVKQNDSN